MNQAASQPAFNREMAKVYLRGTDPEFCKRTWKEVADSLARQYNSSTAQRWAKFIKYKHRRGITREEHEKIME